MGRNVCGCCSHSSMAAVAVVVLLALGGALADGVSSRVNFFEFDPTLRQEVGGPCIPNPSQFTGKKISQLPCQDILVDLPFELSFNGSQPGVLDKSGTPTGMRMYMPASNKKKEYIPADVKLQPGQNRLRLTGRKGTWEGSDNTLRNALGIGLPVPNNAVKLEVDVKMPNTDNSFREKFCLYIAVSDLQFVWLCAERRNNGYRIHLWNEEEDARVTQKNINGVALGTDRMITLRMDIYPARSEIETWYQITGGERKRVATVSVAPLTLNVDQAGTDPLVGTRTMGGFVGIRDPTKVTKPFFVKHFAASVLLPPSNTGSGEQSVDFNFHRIPDILEPTSMVWASARLYVANVLGIVYQLKFNGDRTQVTDIRQYEPIGQRMLTGIAKDPNFASNYCLWLSHSSPSQSMGDANSGMVTKVCGKNSFNQRTDVIVGLPRALANHATNNLWFGDEVLYLAIGGNTASGAPNNWNSLSSFAFQERAEQYLSAALVTFPVFNQGFNGDCTPTQSLFQLDNTGITQKTPPNCDFTLYATGMRNVFSCVIHTTDSIICPDNAIGGRGTFPELPLGYQEGDDCDGIVDVTTDNGAHDPGLRHDALYKVTMGKYYGHPNPARRECVMAGGNPTSGLDFGVNVMPVTEKKKYGFQVKQYPVGVQPHSTYQKPIASFGKNRSPNGIIEYTSTKMCGKLQGQLLTTWFSVEPQIRRIELDAAGEVKNDGTLRRSDLATGGETLNKPLGIAKDNNGNIFVGEFAGNSIMVYNPKAAACSRRTAAIGAPVNVEGAASASDGLRLYAFGGRREGEMIAEAHTYHAGSDTWTVLPDLPEPLAHASAVVAADGRVLIVGGEKADGSASARVWAFDPKTGEYAEHSSLPEGRVGSVATLQGATPVVVGGVTSDGTTPAAGVLRLAGLAAWEALAEMTEPRAHAAGAVGPDGKLLVCGGLLLGDGAQKPIRSCEQLEGGLWRSAAPMGEARSHHALFAHGAKFVAKGGHAEDGSISDSIDVLDFSKGEWSNVGKMRTGRSAAIHAALGGEMYTFSGRTDFDITGNGDAVHIN